MEQARLILSLAGTALSLFVTCTVLLIKVILSFKKHKKLRESSVPADAIAPIMQVAESKWPQKGRIWGTGLFFI